jgi:hypothetical protein
VRLRLLALVALACALTGCESSQEKSAQLERVAKRQAHQLAHSGLTITHPSTRVKVLRASVVSSREGAAAIVTLQNTSPTALAGVPLAITVRDAHGASVYTNTAPGIGHTLITAPLLPAHGQATWVDDQVTTSGGGAPASVSAIVGEGTPASGAAPRITLGAAHLSEGGAEGTVSNHSSTTQSELVVYALARRGGRVVAAGRAVLPQLAAGATVPYQVFFVGEPSGAQLQVSASPTTPG